MGLLRTAEKWLAGALLVLPVVVAAGGVGVAGAAALVAGLLVALWAARIGAALGDSAGGPELRLETIRASHFVEKVRWALDRLGVPYVETPWAGIVGAVLLGRTVPVLHFRTGRVISRIGNSPEILRYLWGRYAAERPEQARFLEPSAEALELERRIDEYGVALQRWAYHHLLAHRRKTLRVLGAYDPDLPLWQRAVLRAGFPAIRIFLGRVFRLRKATHEQVIAPIERWLGEMEVRLADGRTGLLGAGRSYVDYTLAAISGLWLLPEQYGGARMGTSRPRPEDMPDTMAADAARWRRRFPAVVAFVENLYWEERLAPGAA